MNFPQIEELDEVILCKRCTKIVLGFFSDYNYDFYEDDKVLNRCYTSPSKPITCECCNEEVIQKIHYKLMIQHEVQIAVADKISENIGGCEYCEGNERGYFVHKFNDDPFDSDSRIDFDDVSGENASSYVSDQNVPDELNSFFIKLIVCPCGFGRDEMHPRHNPNGGVFETYTDIYTRRDVNSFWGFDVKEFFEFGEKYGEKITQDDLIAFRTLLLHRPMLAYRHRTGKAIYNALEKHFRAGHYAVLNTEDAKLFRGRKRRKDENQYLKEKMWAPPAGRSQHGRYNFVGVSVLYVTDRLISVPYEVRSSTEDVIDIAEIELVEDSLSIFDLDSFDFEFQGFLNDENEESTPVKSAYLLSSYIGECCSSIGYNGVMYRGVHRLTSKDEYMNYALFNVNPNIDLSIKSVKSYSSAISYTLKEFAHEQCHIPADGKSSDSVF